jgi:uncharacterized protein (TIGR00299 family) protein
MSKIAYIDCPTGIAGDMFLGALVDVGVPWQYLQDNLAKLGISAEYQLKLAKVHRQGQLATKVHVQLLTKTSAAPQHHHGAARHLPEIQQIITDASLSDRVKSWSLAIFQQLAIAEGAVHGIEPEKVHFHEVGATDALVDIVGTCLGLDWLKIAALYCSALPTGGGTIKAAHGILPVPVPAVLQLWQSREVPIYNNGIKKELVTPTGAAIATTLAVEFGAPPAMKIEQIGLGAGTQELPIPNILRLWIGTALQPLTSPTQFKQETVTVLETQIDDLNPQIIAYTSEQLLQAGALDVFTQAITMKKSRLGTLLTVICFPQQAETCKKLIFQETSTLGIRERTQSRSILQREITSVTTKYGVVKVKIASYPAATSQKIINVQPEYEDCAILARQHNLPWQQIQQATLEAHAASSQEIVD